MRAEDFFFIETLPNMWWCRCCLIF